jgi:translocation and assembly module TamB
MTSETGPVSTKAQPASTRTWVGRVALWLLAGAALLSVLVLAFLLFVALTPQGARLAISQGLVRSPVPVQVSSIDGTLVGPLTLTGLEVENLGIRTRVARVVLDWQPLQALRRRIVVDSLHVTGIDVLVTEDYVSPPREEGPPTLPELPVELDVRDIRLELERMLWVGRMELRESGLAGSGSLEAFDVQIEVRGEAPQIQELEAQASLAGSPQSYELSGELSFVSAELPVSATISSRGSLTDIEVREARVQTRDGEAQLTARAAWYPTVSWDMEATANVLEIAPFTPTPELWPGHLSFAARSAGELADERLDATVVVEDLSGELRGEPISGALGLSVAGDSVVLDGLELSWGDLQAQGRGSLLEALDLTLDVDVPDVGLALPNATGSARMAAAITGTREAPRVVGTFEARELARDSLRLGLLEGAVDVDLAPDGESDLDVRAAGIASGATVVDSVTLVGAGTRGAHQARLEAWAPVATVAIRLSGALAEPAGESAATGWAGTVDTIDVSSELAGDWSLGAPATVVADADSASLSEACLAQEAARVCAAGGWRRGGASEADLRIEALPLALLAARLPPNITVAGTLEAAAELAIAADGTLTANGTSRAEGTVETMVGVEPVRFALGGEGLSLHVDESGGRAEADFALLPEVGSGSLTATATVELPGYTSLSTPLEEQAIQGRIEAGSDDLGFLSAFSPAVANAGGRMQLEADVTGTAAAPVTRGTLEVAEGRGDVQALGLELRDITLRAAGDAEGGFELAGSLRSGDGTFEANGRSPAVPVPEDRAELRLVGERFLAIATPEIEVVIEPDLEITYDGSLTTVNGRLAVPFARVELTEIPELAVPPSRDVVFVDEEPVEPPLVDATVEVVVGDDVRFQGFGFTSMIEGDLDVREEPGNLPLALGDLRFIEGRFAAYGQNLEVQDGRVVFSGPVADAVLDVTAVRRAQDGTVAGLVVTGGMIEPAIDIISDPAMSDADALSYIMYGRPLTDGDPSEQERVTGAAATLGANVLTTRLASSVGLDEARIEGATREQAELVAGKYLTPSVFVSYGMGLFKPSNTFRIKYLLSSQWAVQAESGDANGGDVLYQIERGR